MARSFSRAELDGNLASVVGLWRDGRLAYINQAWSRFAEDNGGQPAIDAAWGLGVNYFDAIPAVLRPFYDQLFASLPYSTEHLHPIAHTYECSSATRYRTFAMQVYLLPEDTGFLIINSLVVERPHDAKERPPQPADPAAYQDEDGILKQCAHCRRVLRLGEPARWDWVPEWVERMPSSTGHAICPACVGFYFRRRKQPG